MQAEPDKAFFKSFKSRLVPDHVDSNKDGPSNLGPGTELRGVSRKTKGGAATSRGANAAASRR